MLEMSYGESIIYQSIILILFVKFNFVLYGSYGGLVSCNQTAFFSLMIGRRKKGSGTMPALFLCSIPPSLGWLLIGVNKDFLEVTNHGRISSG